MKKAVVLLSGGLDSYTTAVIARHSGYELYALTIEYGQRHKVEVESAYNIARRVGVKDHIVVNFDLLRRVGHSALTDNIPVPEDRADLSGIPVTYVPARNTIFLSYALAWAETIGVHNIFIGVNAVDYSGYPDCRPEFIRAFEKMANLGTKAGVEGVRFSVHTPLINLNKSHIITRGVELGCDYSLSVSCYQADEQGRACGRCDSCLIRKKGFIQAGIVDPTVYME